jgi:hypothetical protein
MEIFRVLGPNFDPVKIRFLPNDLEVIIVGNEGEVTVWSAFPLDERKYPGAPSASLAEKVESYKREYWKQTLADRHPVYGASVAEDRLERGENVQL